MREGSLEKLKRYRATIVGIGLKDVKAVDIDEAYEIVCKEYCCSINDILVMACLDPLHP